MTAERSLLYNCFDPPIAIVHSARIAPLSFAPDSVLLPAPDAAKWAREEGGSKTDFVSHATDNKTQTSDCYRLVETIADRHSLSWP
jgi:hypothetical protein